MPYTLPIPGRTLKSSARSGWVQATHGQWTDTFNGYQVHLYRLGSAHTP